MHLRFVFKLNINYRALIYFLATCFYYIVFSSLSVFANNIEIKSINVFDDHSIEMELYNGLESTISINAKIGVSTDESDFGNGLILNSQTGDFIKYSARWDTTPNIDIHSNSSVIINGKIDSQIVVLDSGLHFRFRYKDLSTGDIYNTDSSFYNFVYQASSLPTPTVVPSQVASENQPTPNPTNLEPPKEDILDSVKEVSTDKDIDELVLETLTKSQKQNIQISEFFPYPLKGEKEWVELYNNNDTKVNLKGWFLDDIINSGGADILFDASIEAKGYYVIEYSKSLLNNTGDSVSLLDENKNLVHTISYKKAKQDYSIQKISNTDFYITKSNTKGLANLDLEIKSKKNEKPEALLEESTDTATSFENVKAEETSAKANSINDNSPQILGDSIIVDFKKPEFKKYTFYPAEKPFTPTKVEGDVYIYTSNNQKKFYEYLFTYIEKAFW